MTNLLTRCVASAEVGKATVASGAAHLGVYDSGPAQIENMRHAAATIPRAEACELDGIAHLPSLDAPERLDAPSSAFLHDAGPA